MVLKYMVSAAELADDEVTRRKIEVSIPKKPKNKAKIAAQFFALLVANIIVLTLAYNVWASEKGCPLWENCYAQWKHCCHLIGNRGVVTGIIYNAENPSAIVCGQVVHEGDIVGDYKVVRIYPEKVELNKKGELIIKEVH
jgi:hypothetical protein